MSTGLYGHAISFSKNHYLYFMFRCAFLYIVLIEFFFVNGMNAQRFGGGIHLAGVLSQIDGDDAYGFNKAGFEAGVYGKAKLSRISDLEIHFSYNQRGSRSTIDDIRVVKFNLNYIDIPVLFVLKDWLNAEGSPEYYRMNFFGGLSVGRLISSSSLTRLDEDFRKTDLSWIVGTTYFYARSWGITAKYTHSITPLYVFPQGNRQVKMISYFISLGLNYSFN